MVSQFPLPVLSVAADAVRDLEGRDALSGLWTLFTKCKESLQDGRRLENISWRLWYREMMLESHERELDSFDKLALSSGEKPADLGHPSDTTVVNEKVGYPLPIPSESTPTPPPYSSYNLADGGAPPSMPPNQPHLTSDSVTHAPSLSPAPLSSLSPVLSPRLSPSIPVSNRRPSLSRSRRSSFLNSNNGTPLNVGKIIYDMLPSSSSTSSNSSSESSNGGIQFLPGPVLSRRSTSTTISSTSDINIKTDTDHALSQSAPSRHDPMIQMTPLVPVPSSPPTSRPSLNLADGIRPTKRGVSDLPSNPIPGNVIVSCLPTPEMEEDEPDHSALAIPSDTNGLQGVRSQSPSLITTIPASTIPNVSAARNNNETTTTTRSVNDAFNEMLQNARTHDSSDASSPLPVQQSVYTGPPSPSLSDSYANAHPGEVEVKEVGILPSLSIANQLAVDFAVPQPRVDEEAAPVLPIAANQTPPTDSPSMAIPPIQTTFQHPQPPPTLVVVNPTPNPTPHPTPPATPLMHGVIGFGGVLRSQWLALPDGAAGSRQHQLLQAAQAQAQQQALLGPQLTTLRLPPAFGNTSNNNITNVIPTISGGGASRDLDRSRSFTITTGASESQLEESPEIEQPLPQPTSSTSLEGKHNQPRASSRDNVNRLSISSTASNRSRISNISDQSSVGGRAESTTTTTTDTTLASESELLQTLAGLSAAEKAAMFEIHGGGMSTHGMKLLGSLSTLQSMTTLSDRRKDVGGGGGRTSDCEGDARGTGEGVNGVSDEEVIVEDVVDEEDDAPLSPLPPPGGLAMSPRSSSEKRKKRNSAPIPDTSLSALLSVSPSPSASGSGQQFTASPKSAASTTFASHTTAGNGKRKQITAGGGALSRQPSTGRSTSRSRSAGGSSVGQSRSRSREPGVGLGGGGLGMTVAAPPPVAAAATTRKAPMVAGGGRGRAKVVLGRQTSLKAKNALRRNSSGNGGGAASDNGVVEQDLEKDREEKEHQGRMKLEALEKEREKSLQLEADKRRMEEQALAAQRQREEEERLKAEQERREEVRRERERSEGLTAGMFEGEEGASSKRPVRFNIGSNSDEGRSAGSGSDVSGAHTNAQAKERQREIDQRRISQQLQQQQVQPQQQQQQPAQNQVRDQQHYPQQPQRQLSKPQLRQLQMMEQLHMQHQNQTKIHPHHPQQQQLQSQQQQQQLQERHLPPSRQASTKQLSKEVIKEEGRAGETRKGKEREAQVSPRAGQSTKLTKGNSKANTVLNDDMAAKVQQSIAAPLLPVTRRKIELVTSESEFETDSEDEGSWSSEGMTGDDEEQRALEEQLQQQQLQQLQQQQLHLQQQQQQQIQLQRQRQQQQAQLDPQQQNQRQQPPLRPQGVQRAHSEHYPAQNNGRNGRQASRAQQRQAQANTQAIVEAAALEAQRQREMFVKLPSSSFQNLANARTRSVGLLTQLLNPNPEIFPVNHPYRRGFSSGEIRPGGGPAAAPMRPLTSTATAAPPPPPSVTYGRPSNQGPEERQERPAQQQRRSDGGGDRKSSGAAIPSRINFSPPKRPGGMNRTKSAAALPVSYNVAIGSMGSTAAPVLDHTSALPTTTTANPGSLGKFRPRARPADAELEDDSGSEAEGGLQLSKSVAHEKLKALAQRGGITSNQRNHDARTHDQAQADQSHADENDVPQWAKVSQPEDGQQRQRQRSNLHNRNGVQFAVQPPAPITFGYPYNLPPPAAPSTPRTTRRQMLSNELTEDLRRNLLWERQVSNSNLAAMKRSASGGGSRHSILGGLRPLTSGPSMVQLHAKGTGPPESDLNDDRQRRPSAADEEERRRKAMARNKSWANDYHHSGW